MQYAVTDKSGNPLACQLNIIPLENQIITSSSDSLTCGEAGIIYTLKGCGQQTLPPGPYRYVISHGPFFEIVDQKINLKSGQTAHIRHTLRKMISADGYLAADFHIHSKEIGHRNRVISLLLR